MEHIQAVDKFLDGCLAVLSEADFGQARAQQCAQLADHLAAGSCTTDEAGDLLRALSSSPHWTREEVASLGRTVTCTVSLSSQTKALQLDKDAVSRVKLQDFADFVGYLCPSDWAILTNESYTTCAKLQHVSEFLVRLGLRAPTEATSAAVTALLLQVKSKEPRPTTYSGWFQLFGVAKAYLRRALQAARPPPADYPHVLVLPSSWRDHPECWCREAFQGALPQAASPVPLQTLRALTASVPMRKNNKNLVDEKKLQGQEGCTKNLLRMLLSQLRLAQEDEETLPGLQLLFPKKQSLPAPAAVQQLEDRAPGATSLPALQLEVAAEKASDGKSMDSMRTVSPCSLRSSSFGSTVSSASLEKALHFAAPVEVPKPDSGLISAAEQLRVEMGGQPALTTQPTRRVRRKTAAAPAPDASPEAQAETLSLPAQEPLSKKTKNSKLPGSKQLKKTAKKHKARPLLQKLLS